VLQHLVSPLALWYKPHALGVLQLARVDIASINVAAVNGLSFDHLWAQLSFLSMLNGVLVMNGLGVMGLLSQVQALQQASCRGTSDVLVFALCLLAVIGCSLSSLAWLWRLLMAL